MKDFSGKTAFVTGGANGIGLGLCRALARRGTNLIVADIEQEQLDEAMKELSRFNVRTHAIRLDVSDSAAFDQAAAEAEAVMGNIHFLFNNAGVSLGAAPLWQVPADGWKWIFDVNVFGAINGIRSFVPRMLAHGEAGHIVNTASIGGLQVNPQLRNGSYTMTKYALVAASEALALDLEDSQIGVSVLCPALVATTLYASSHRRPARYGGPYERREEPAGKARHFAGLPPDEVGQRVLAAVEQSEFFIFTHEEPREWIEARHRRLLSGFDSLANYQASRT